jgi:xanthine/CO dehydrogenase XdhC/CoxF family maturation factor
MGVLVTVHSSMDPRYTGLRLLAAEDAAGEFHWVGFSGVVMESVAGPEPLQALLEECASLAHSDSLTARTLKRRLIAEGDHLGIELIRADPDLIICGAGHVGQALAPMSRLLGLGVVMIDDREVFANRGLFPDPGIRLVVEDYERGLAKTDIRESSCIVIVTRAHQNDEQCLRAVLHSKARYIGMIGSRRRVLAVMRKLEAEGYPPDQLAKVKAPIGLEIGAQSPAEVAVSILAEIILLRRGGTGASMSEAKLLKLQLHRGDTAP